MSAAADVALKHQAVALDLAMRAGERLKRAKAAIAGVETPEADRLRRAYAEALGKLGHVIGAIYLEPNVEVRP